MNILAQAMHSMAIRGFIVHNRETGVCAYTQRPRGAFLGHWVQHPTERGSMAVLLSET
jgi:hypothetical protein